MFRPRVEQGVEQGHFCTRFRIDSTYPIGFAKTAVRALEDKVVQCRSTSVTPRLDVVNVEGRALTGLTQLTIPAPPAVALSDPVTE